MSRAGTTHLEIEGRRADDEVGRGGGGGGDRARHFHVGLGPTTAACCRRRGRGGGRVGGQGHAGGLAGAVLGQTAGLRVHLGGAAEGLRRGTEEGFVCGEGYIKNTVRGLEWGMGMES